MAFKKPIKKGFVYIASNPSFDLIKVGYTTKSPEKRLAEIYSTGVPTPFKLEYVFKTRRVSASHLERDIHRLLAKHRPNPRREFFDIAPEQARAEISKMLNSGSVNYRLRMLVRAVVRWALIVAVVALFFLYGLPALLSNLHVGELKTLLSGAYEAIKSPN